MLGNAVMTKSHRQCAMPLSGFAGSTGARTVNTDSNAPIASSAVLRPIVEPLVKTDSARARPSTPAASTSQAIATGTNIAWPIPRPARASISVRVDCAAPVTSVAAVQTATPPINHHGDARLPRSIAASASAVTP